MFPEEIVKYSAEDHFHRNNVRGRPVYFAAIIFLTGSLIALPFIKVNVTFAARGFLRTAETATLITAPVAGRISNNYIQPNSFVNRYDTLIIIDHTALDSEMETLLSAKKLVEGYIYDLDRLLAGKEGLVTERYRNAEMEYGYEIKLLENDLTYIRENHNSNRQLYEGGFIARTEYESARMQLLTAETRLEVKRKEFHTRWQGELSEYTMDYLQLNAKLAHLQKSRELHTITSPVQGYIVDYRDLTIGSYLKVSDEIARLVPDMELVATCMVSPDKISRISIGQQVRINIDTYPGTAFGTIQGTVASIPKDVTIYSNVPSFPVLCIFQQGSRHHTGISQVILKSGMTCTGLFVLSKRSLLNLIIEKGEKIIFPDNRKSDYEE